MEKAAGLFIVPDESGTNDRMNPVLRQGLDSSHSLQNDVLALVWEVKWRLLEHRFQPVGPPDLSGGKGYQDLFHVPDESGGKVWRFVHCAR
ncbi:MAG: hypothetical protein RBT36_07150 [Desulfobulbus sp.]|nr:hypothetical protein [Desulfobulbus sp.]